MRRLIWKFFRGQIRSSKKKPRPRVLGRGLGSFWRNLFRSSTYYLGGFVHLFKQKICCLKAKQMLQKYHAGNGKVDASARWPLPQGRGSSRNKESSPDSWVVVLSILNWRNNYE